MPEHAPAEETQDPEDLVEHVKKLTQRLEESMDDDHSNPGSAQLIISELKGVGQQITGAINLLDNTMKQNLAAVQDSCKRVENVQKALDILRYATWPSLVAIILTLLSIWAKSLGVIPTPTP